MVDLDSDPTKLLEVIAIGKQLLITRGSITTFSIANDVAKYFAIVPAMFVAVYPELNTLNVMGLSTPQSAILSAVIFNALIIVALIPLALRGVAFRAGPGERAAPAQPAHLRPRRDHRPVHRDQADRPRRHRSPSRLGRTDDAHVPSTPAVARDRHSLWPSPCSPASPTRRRSPRSPRSRFPSQANGSFVTVADGRTIGSSLIGQAFERPEVLLGPAVGGRHGRLRRERLGRLEPRPDERGPDRAGHQDQVDGLRAANGDAPIPVDLVTTSASGLDPDISPADAQYQVARVAERARHDRGRRPGGRRPPHRGDRCSGFLGQPRVNVLLLNLDLDGLLAK